MRSLCTLFLHRVIVEMLEFYMESIFTKWNLDVQHTSMALLIMTSQSSFSLATPDHVTWQNMPCPARFSENTVIRNTKTNTKWGKEERDGGFPFSPGTIANISLTVQPAFYEVGVNGHHFTRYCHRLPFQPHMTVFVTEEMSHITSIDYSPGC